MSYNLKQMKKKAVTYQFYPLTIKRLNQLAKKRKQPQQVVAEELINKAIDKENKDEEDNRA